jgi:betaine-aldehyde dehydrogenase
MHDEFVARLTERMKELVPGPPTEAASRTGAIVNQSQVDKILKYVAIAQDEGATLLTGGDRVDGDLADGLFVRPALLDGVTPDSTIAQTEIFGPVLSVLTYTDYDDAIRIANGISLGLTAGAYTTSLKTAHAFARDVKCGYVWVNDTATHFGGASFGGVKESGLGREADLDEVRSYTQNKNVNIKFA